MSADALWRIVFLGILLTGCRSIMPFHTPETSLLSPPKLEAEPPAVTRRLLPNGLTLLVLEDHSNPLVAFHAVIPTGSATEGRFYGTGVSHVLEHMLFKGTTRRPVGAIEQEARSYGGTTQGFTNYDTTSFQVVANKEFWSQAADLLVDALFFPTMDPEEFKKESQVVLRELRIRRDDPDQVAWDLLFENAYRVHPYRAPIIGYEPLLTRLSREDALAYHRSHYFPNTVVMAVVGDIDTEAVIRRITDLTAAIPTGSVPPPVLPEEPLPMAPRAVTETVEAAHGIVAIGFPGVSMNSQDLYAVDLLAWLLGGGRGSRLEKALKETGIVHEVGCFNYTPQHPGLFVLSMRMEVEKMSNGIDAAFHEIALLKSKEFSPSEIDAGKRAVLREYLASRQTVTGQASDLASFEVLVGDPTFATRYIQEIERVTAEDLKRVANRYLTPERMTLVRLFPKGSITAPSKESTSASVRSTAEKAVLPNGLRILLKEDHRIPLVNLQASLLAGVRYETEATNGISALTARMLIRGTRKKNAQQIIDQVKRMGGRLEPSSGRNTLGLSVEVIPSELSQAVELLGELLLEPTFPAEEFEKERRLALAALKQNEEEPFSWGMRRLAATLFTIHPYRLDPAGNLQALSDIKPTDMIQFHHRILDPKRMVISVVGDFNRQELQRQFTKIFGRMESAQTNPPSIPTEPPLIHLKEHREITPRREALILIGFQGIPVNDSRVPALDLIETILSGGAGRLFTEVRERRGLAYTVGAFAIHGIEPGAFVLYAVTDPAQIDTVRQELLEEIQRLATTLVPEEEFRRAQQGLLGSRRIARQTQTATAAQIGLDELLGVGYDFTERYEASVQAAKPEDLKEVAQALLNPKACGVVIGQRLPLEEAAPRPSGQPKEGESLSKEGR